MRITCPKEAIHWDFVVQSAKNDGEYTIKGSKPYDSMIDHGELAVIMRPARSYEQRLKDWMCLCYAPDDYIFKHIGIKHAVWLEMYNKLLNRIISQSKAGKAYPLTSMMIENFICSEHNSKRVYSKADYCEYLGMHQSHYNRDWRLIDDLVCGYLRKLSNDVLEPIRQNIINLRKAQKSAKEETWMKRREKRLQKSA